MSSGQPDPFLREVARVALAAAQQRGFVLGGGLAWILSGLVARPTEDVDLFSPDEGAAAAVADQVRDALRASGYTVEEAEAESDLDSLFDGFAIDLREFVVRKGDHSVRLTLSRLERRRSPIMMDIGPAMHRDDLFASKVAALINRREVRDYIDVAAALRHRSIAQLLELARRQDPGLEPGDIPDVGRYLDQLNDKRFTYYGFDQSQINFLREQFAEWPRR